MALHNIALQNGPPLG